MIEAADVGGVGQAGDDGSIARRLLGQGIDVAFAEAEQWLELVWAAERVQVNLPEPDVLNPDAHRRLVIGVGKPVILQLRQPDQITGGGGGEAGTTSRPHFPLIAEGATWLFDRSAGSGATPGFWPVLPSRRGLVGYAGGIGPDNAAEVVTAIFATNPSSPARFWVDMETKVRENGSPHFSDMSPPSCFSLPRCRVVMNAVARFLP